MRNEPKKIESLEVRLPPETKAAFMAACRANGKSASEVIRSYVERYVRLASGAPNHSPMELNMVFARSTLKAKTIAGLVAGAVATCAITLLGTPALASPDDRIAALFQWLDRDRNEGLSMAEFVSTPEDAPSTGAIRVDVTTKTPPKPGETRDALFRRLDRSRDGSLSLGELDAGSIVRTVVAPGIVAADVDADGMLSEGEVAAYLVAQNPDSGAQEAVGAALLARGIINAAGGGRVPIEKLLRH